MRLRNRIDRLLGLCPVCHKRGGLHGECIDRTMRAFSDMIELTFSEPLMHPTDTDTPCILTLPVMRPWIGDTRKPGVYIGVGGEMEYVSKDAHPVGTVAELLDDGRVRVRIGQPPC